MYLMTSMLSKPKLYGLIPNQPHPLASYLAAGKLLHVSVILFVLESYIYAIFLQNALLEASTVWSFFWTICFLFSFVHIFLVIADGWSRFQDYKRAKDQLFLYGFQPRIINQFANSHCQRIACSAAAKDLGFGEEAKEHFDSMGYLWYHLIPEFMMKDPLFFSKRYFWKRTFLEKYYKARFNYRELSLEFQYK